MENTSSNQNNQSFYQFSDQLRLQTSNLANLNIWSGGNSNTNTNSFPSKNPEGRRNFDIRVGGEREKRDPQNPQKGGQFNEFNGFNNGWKIGGTGLGVLAEKNNGLNGLNGTSTGSTGVEKNYGLNVMNELNGSTGVQKNHGLNGLNGMNGVNGNGVFHTKYGSNKSGGRKNRKEEDYENRTEKKKNSNNNGNGNKKDNNNDKNGVVDKRFKTLPAAEALPRNEVVGGYIFVCNNDTMEENLKRQLFGLPPRYRDSVRAITPGLPLFLYNYSTHQLHGIFQAASFGGTNIDPTAWEDKKCPGESRFPAQVKVATRKICNPLEEDAFRPILHHYDGPKFRLELNIPEALALLDIFADGNP